MKTEIISKGHALESTARRWLAAKWPAGLVDEFGGFEVSAQVTQPLSTFGVLASIVVEEARIGVE